VTTHASALPWATLKDFSVPVRPAVSLQADVDDRVVVVELSKVVDGEVEPGAERDDSGVRGDLRYASTTSIGVS